MTEERETPETAGPPARRPPIRGEELERVFRRAAELQLVRENVPESLDESEVLRIAEEAGLEGRWVRQALAELRAEAMVPAAPADAGAAARLLGPGLVRASRVVPGAPGEVLDHLARHLRDRESLRIVRSRTGYQLWEPASDVMSKINRSLDFSGRGYELARCRSFEVSAEPLEAGRSLVTVTADLRNRRTGHAAGWLATLGLPGLGVIFGLVFGEGASALLVAPAVSGTVLAVSGLGAASTYGRRRRRVDLAVQGLLDRLESGGGLSADRPGLRERIVGMLDGE